MKYIITESHFKHYVSVITEQEDDDDDEYDKLESYSDEDFIEVFFNYFRPWIKSNHGDEISQYPLSLLLKKYYQEFCKYSGVDIDDDDEFRYYSDLIKIGKALIKKEQHKLPTLRPVSKFTEKHSKQIQSLLKLLKMPEWLTVSFEEYSPYKVYMTFNIDFPSMMKIGGGEQNISTYFYEFTEQLENYMGIKVGSPSHGDLDINNTISLNGVDEFNKPKFQKELKSQIKSLLTGHKDIHTIKLRFTDKGITLEIGFGRNVMFSDKQLYKKAIIDLLSTKYSEDKIRIFF
jgi:hypothetical protein